MCGDRKIECVCGPYPVFPEGHIYRFDDRLPSKLPFAANVHNWLYRLVCPVKRNHKPGLG